MPERPKMEEMKSICFWCKQAQVMDAENVVRRMLGPNLITQQPMVEEAHIFSYLVLCHARSGVVPLNPETVIHHCTDFVEMEAIPEMSEPVGKKEKITETVQ